MKMWGMLLFFCCLNLAAQRNIGITPISDWPLKADAFVGYDNFGFAYYIKDNVFVKTDQRRSVEYKSVALGKITAVDIRNPLQIVLFYEDFNAVVLLDNQLNETRRVLFSDHDIPIVAAAVGMSAQNKLWVYNSLSQKVGLYDYVNGNYREITVPLAGKPVFYQSDFNYFYWMDAERHLMATDIYGKVSNFGIAADFDHYLIAADHWGIWSKGPVLTATNLLTGGHCAIANVQKTFKSLHYHAQILSIFTTEGITNYKITLP